MSSRFDTCLNFVLDWEGRRVEFDPHDPGGVTAFGIDQRDHPSVDVKHLTFQEAVTIYHVSVWDRFVCDKLAQPWDLLVFDSAVNPGPKFPVRAMQSCLCVNVDGFIGPKTLAAVKSNASVNGKFNAGIKCFIQKRLEYYDDLPTRLKNRYLHGWINRTIALQNLSGVRSLVG